MSVAVVVDGADLLILGEGRGQLRHLLVLYWRCSRMSSLLTVLMRPSEGRAPPGAAEDAGGDTAENAKADPDGAAGGAVDLEQDVFLVAVDSEGADDKD